MFNAMFLCVNSRQAKSLSEKIHFDKQAELHETGPAGLKGSDLMASDRE